LNSPAYRRHNSHTFSAFPLNATKVPLRVYKFCDGESWTERRENGAPRTSNRASISQLALTIPPIEEQNSPGFVVELSASISSSSAAGFVELGVAYIRTYRRPMDSDMRSRGRNEVLEWAPQLQILAACRRILFMTREAAPD
jgi:hypothetical protein